MMEDELIKIWQSSPREERVKFDRSRLIIDMQTSLDRFHRAIKFRDLREIIPAIILIPFFAYKAYTLPQLLSKIGAILIVVWGIYVIFKLLFAKMSKPASVADNYVDYLYQTRKYLIVQKQLLDTVLYWYILPCFVGILMIVLGTAEITKISLSGIVQNAGIAIYIVVVIALCVFIYFLNKRAVKKEFVPRLKKINELIEVIKE